MTIKRFTKFIFVSILFHLILVGTINLVALLKRTPPPSRTVEIEFVTPPQEIVKNKKSQPVKIDTTQVVDQDEDRFNNETPEKADYLSRHSQTVKKQTVSRNRGEFKNVKNKPALHPKKETMKVATGSTKAFDPLSELDHRFKEKQMENIGKNPEERAQAKTNGGDVSQSQDYLKNIDPGFETLLNTKEFKYYTYFNRIRRQLSQHWEPKVREKLSNMFRRGRSIASDQDKITKLLIVLSPAGQLVNVQVISDSGVKDLDDAAIEAFRLAAPFPNPPKGIVDPDGTVKIRWDFVLES